MNFVNISIALLLFCGVVTLLSLAYHYYCVVADLVDAEDERDQAIENKDHVIDLLLERTREVEQLQLELANMRTSLNLVLNESLHSI